MKAEEIIRGAEILLLQMVAHPDEIQAALAPEDRERLLQVLPDLVAQAAAVKDGDELLELAKAIHRLIEETPGLRNLLLPKDMDIAAAQQQRKVTMRDYDATVTQGQYVQMRAAQVENTLLVVNKRLLEKLEDKVGRDDDRKR